MQFLLYVVRIIGPYHLLISTFSSYAYCIRFAPMFVNAYLLIFLELWIPPCDSLQTHSHMWRSNDYSYAQITHKPV
jgi:hypothetical protein